MIERRVALGIGTRSEHARAAIHRGGRRVRCAGSKPDTSDACGWRGRRRTSRLRRLRQMGCPECGGNLHPENWPGFDA